MEIIRKKLSPDELSSPGQRYDETCDCPQISPDGGTTWNDAPGLDTRHTNSYRLPALTGGTAACDAAANMVELVRRSVDILVTTGTLVGAVSPMLDLWIIAVGPVGWLVELIIIAVQAALGIGTVAVNAAFTEGVYDDLLCIFLAHMDADGQVSAAQFAEIQTDIDGLDSVVNAVMDLFFTVWGEVGLSNAGASGTETGDCDACGAWCHYWYATVGWSGWSQVTDLDWVRGNAGDPSVNSVASIPSIGNNIVGSGFTQSHIPVAVQLDFGATVTLTAMSMTGSGTQSVAADDGTDTWAITPASLPADATAVRIFVYSASNPSCTSITLEGQSTPDPIEDFPCP